MGDAVSAKQLAGLYTWNGCADCMLLTASWCRELLRFIHEQVMRMILKARICTCGRLTAACGKEELEGAMLCGLGQRKVSSKGGGQRKVVLMGVSMIAQDGAKHKEKSMG